MVSRSIGNTDQLLNGLFQNLSVRDEWNG
jgi:hypothetical protein